MMQMRLIDGSSAIWPHGQLLWNCPDRVEDILKQSLCPRSEYLTVETMDLKKPLRKSHTGQEKDCSLVPAMGEACLL